MIQPYPLLAFTQLPTEQNQTKSCNTNSQYYYSKLSIQKQLHGTLSPFSLTKTSMKETHTLISETLVTIKLGKTS